MAGSREKEIIEAYEAWSPDEQTVTDLVEELGISRQRLYNVLDRNAVMPKTRRVNQKSTIIADSTLLEEMAEMALGYLLRQLQEARAELAEYRQKYGDLED